MRSIISFRQRRDFGEMPNVTSRGYSLVSITVRVSPGIAGIDGLRGICRWAEPPSSEVLSVSVGLFGCYHPDVKATTRRHRKIWIRARQDGFDDHQGTPPVALKMRLESFRYLYPFALPEPLKTWIDISYIDGLL